MKRIKCKHPEIDWIIFDSSLECDIYKEFKNNNIHLLPWLEDLKWFKIIKPRADEYEIFPAFKCWDKSFRALKYTPDFIIQKWKEVIVIEVKSKWTAIKPDYRLRIKMFLYKYSKEIKFAELIKYNNKKYELIKYYE